MDAAGGHLSGLAAVSCNAAVLEPKQTVRSYAPGTKDDPITSSKVSDCVQGGVTWYGVFDMATIADQSRQDKAMSRDVPDAPEGQLLGCFGNKCKQEQIAAASPVTYVDRNDPPMLLIVGTEDTMVPYHQTLEMAEKLKAAGVKHELIVLPGINHSFIGKTPDQTRDANLKALAATFQFIDRTIGSASTANRRHQACDCAGESGVDAEPEHHLAQVEIAGVAGAASARLRDVSVEEEAHADVQRCRRRDNRFQAEGDEVQCLRASGTGNADGRRVTGQQRDRQVWVGLQEQAGGQIDADVFETCVDPHRDDVLFHRERDAAQDGAEAGARIDGQRRGDPELNLVRSAEVGAQCERFAAERTWADAHRTTRAPVRVRAVQGQLDSAPRERDWTIDDRLDLLGARGGTAEKNGNQCVGHAHPRFITEPSGTSIIGRIRQRPTHGQRDR